MTGGGSIFTVSVDDSFVKSTEVAVIETIVSVATTAGATKVALVVLLWVRVPVFAGEAVNKTPPLFVSFNTLAVIETMPPWPITMVPLGVIWTEWKVSGVSAQLESCSTAKSIRTNQGKCRARLFMALLKIQGEIRLRESPTIFRHERAGLRGEMTGANSV